MTCLPVCVCECVTGVFQVTGAVPTVSIEKTDGCMLYLSRESLNAVIVSAKSSEMNILVPDATGEFVSPSVVCDLLIRASLF